MEDGQPKPLLVRVCVADYWNGIGEDNGADNDNDKMPFALQSTVGDSFGHILQVVESRVDEDRLLSSLVQAHLDASRRNTSFKFHVPNENGRDFDVLQD